MKIAFFIKSFYGGGAERVVVNLANELVKNHEVLIIVADNSGHYTEQVSQNVKIIELTKPSIRQIMYDLPKISKDFSFDVLISNLIHENIFASIAWFLSNASYPLIKVEHNKVSEEMSVGSKGKVRLTKLLWWLTKNIGTITIGVSKGVSDDLMAKGVKSVKSVYNPILTEKDIQEKTDSKNRQNDKLLFVGRLVEQKNPIMAIRILQRLRAQGGNHTLTIAGEGPLEYEIKQYLKDNNLESHVSMLGFVKDINSLYLKHQFLLLTSKFEGFGNVIVEASYRGCTPICRDVEFGPSEIITHRQIGFLLPSNAAEKDFVNVVENHRFQTQLPQTRRQLESRFSVGVISKHYEQLIRETKI